MSQVIMKGGTMYGVEFEMPSVGQLVVLSMAFLMLLIIFRKSF